MFVKAIGALLLLGFFYVQLGTSLECYSCGTRESCKSPSKITCNSDNANATSAHLSVYFRENLTNSASTNFDCFHHNYTSVATNVTYKGCVYRPIDPCNLSFRDEYRLLKRESCYKCSGNLCNASPAGTFSSSMMTMIVSMFVVAVYKVLKM